MDRNRGLDGARGLAALSVALAHCNTHYTGTVVWAYRLSDFRRLDASQIALRLWDTVFNGDAAVMLFFVLSGYVLSRSLERQCETPTRAFAPYLIKRIFRLYPCAIVAGAVAYLIYPITVRQMIGTMLMTDISVNGVLWSLQIELIGSALVFVLWACGSRWVSVVVALLLPAIWMLVPHAELSFQFFTFPVAFVLGYLIPQIPDYIWSRKWLFAGGLVMLCVTDLVTGRNSLALAGQMIGATVVVGFIQAVEVPFLKSRVCQFLGYVSYPFYLLHSMIEFVVMQRIDSAMPDASLLVKVPLLALVSIPASLAVAYAVTMLVEKPGIRLGSALVKRPPMFWRA